MSAETVELIDPRAARLHLASSSAVLVCAYDSAETCRANRIDDAIALAELEAKAASLSRSQEIIFYCACPHEGTSARRAEQYRARGFSNVKALAGGVEAWWRTETVPA
jgi:rhodanese-related sulfurtransferase